MFMIVFLFILGVLLLCLGMLLIMARKDSVFSILVIVGFVILVFDTFSLVPREFSTGLPTTTIDVGVYDVKFVYLEPNDDYIMLGVMCNTFKKEKEKNICLYKLPKEAFDCVEIKKNATKLAVIEAGGFKKLKLK